MLYEALINDSTPLKLKSGGGSSVGNYVRALSERQQRQRRGGGATALQSQQVISSAAHSSGPERPPLAPASATSAHENALPTGAAGLRAGARRPAPPPPDGEPRTNVWR